MTSARLVLPGGRLVTKSGQVVAMVPEPGDEANGWSGPQLHLSMAAEILNVSSEEIGKRVADGKLTVREFNGAKLVPAKDVLALMH